jgi:hypothetical protein
MVLLAAVSFSVLEHVGMTQHVYVWLVEIIIPTISIIFMTCLGTCLSVISASHGYLFKYWTNTQQQSR